MRQLGNDLNLGFTSRGGGGLTLTREARAKHLYIVGSTGTGKSKLEEHLIRQDILAWPTSRCGLIVLDPHGSLFDSLMSWIAAKGLRHLPIVPIDLRRGDWVVSYNVLRRRAVGDPAVIMGSLARSIVHAWGQGNMDETPRLAKWLTVILGTLYEGGHTLVDALHLFRSPELRRAMTADLKSFVSRTVWEIADGLRPAEFHEEISSTVNRLLRFLGTQVMRAMLCQKGPSLDLGEAIDKGSIILVSMATAKTQIDEEDDDSAYTASEGRSNSASESLNDTESESWGETQSSACTDGETESHSTGTSRAETQGVNHAPMLMPIMGQEASPPQFRSVEEQLFQFTQMLAGQPDRHAVARLAGTNVPVSLAVPEVKPGLTTTRYTDSHTIGVLGKLPYALPMDEAIRRLDHHQSTFADKVLATVPPLEPVVLARRVDVKVLPPSKKKMTPRTASRRGPKA